jgi:hypothetical protein
MKSKLNFYFTVIAVLTLVYPPLSLAAQKDELIVLQCKDLRKYIHTSKGNMEKRDNAYRMEIGLTLDPIQKVKFLHWGYFPHTETDWGQSSSSHKENLMYMPDLFKIIRNDETYIHIERDEKSFTTDGFWNQLFIVNRVSGEFSYTSAILDENRNFVKYAGIEGISSLEGFCEVERRKEKLF